MTVATLTEEFAVAAEEMLRRARDADGYAADAESDLSLAREAGWLDVLRPEDHGGLGLGLAELFGVFWAAGRYVFAGPLLEHSVVVPLLEHQGCRVSGRIAVVDRRGSPVRYASGAETLIVLAETGVAVVPAERAIIEPLDSLDPAVTYAHVTVAVDEASIIPLDLDELRAAMLVMVACELGGAAERALELATEYATRREQFGRSIGSFQAIQHLLAEMARRRHGIEWACRLAVAARHENLPTAARVAKVAAASGAREIVEGALQIHGGIAFTVEHVLHRYYKHVLGLETFLGSPRQLVVELGDALLTPGATPWPSW